VAGVPSSGFVGRREGAWSLLVVPAVGAALDLGDRVAIVIDVASALVLPRTTIAIAGAASAQIGVATPMATLGLRARF
jgi:hypothetical protein